MGKLIYMGFNCECSLYCFVLLHNEFFFLKLLYAVTRLDSLNMYVTFYSSLRFLEDKRQ